MAFAVLEESEGPAITLASPVQQLRHHDGPVLNFVNGKVIGDQRRARLLAVFEFDDDGPRAAASTQFIGTSTSIPSSAQPRLEAFGQKREDVEHCGFAAAIGTEEHRHWG